MDSSCVSNLRNSFLSQLDALPQMTLTPTPYLRGHFKDGLTAVKEWNLFDFSVSRAIGPEGFFDAFKKGDPLDVVPLQVLEIAKNSFDSLAEAYASMGDQLSNVRRSLAQKEFTIQNMIETAMDLDRALTSKNRRFNKVINLINLCVMSLLTIGLVGSYFTSREDYKEYKKTKLAFNGLLVAGVAAFALSALRMIR